MARAPHSTEQFDSSQLSVEEVPGLADEQTDGSKLSCSTVVYASLDEDKHVTDDGGRIMSMEESFNFLQGLVQEDHADGPSLSALPAHSDPFHDDWPYWNTPVDESDR
jgi:hypothetical protein